MAADLEKIRQSLDTLLAKTDNSNVTEEGVKSELPDGYYLCEVTKAELTESKQGNPMVAIEYKTTEDGKMSVIDEDGMAKMETAPKTQDKKIFVNYVLSSEQNVNYFVADMLKFEDPETGDSIFDKKSDFDSTDAIINVCDILSEGAMVYIMASTTESTNEPGKMVKKYKPISWKRAERLELI